MTPPARAPAPAGWVTAAEAQRRLGIPYSTLAALLAKGLPTTHVGQNRLVPLTVATAMLQDRRRGRRARAAYRKEIAPMTSASTAEVTPVKPGTPGQLLERVVIEGDLARLSADQRVAYYHAVCRSLGLNPLTKPFDYITLSGKLTLYARKDATDQLRRLYGVSITALDHGAQGEYYVATAAARLPDGRQDTEVGAVSIKGLTGEAYVNAMLKAVTKSKRRVTLSICGLGLLDETEAETVPDARLVDPESGEVYGTVRGSRLTGGAAILSATRVTAPGRRPICSFNEVIEHARCGVVLTDRHGKRHACGEEPAPEPSMNRARKAGWPSGTGLCGEHGIEWMDAGCPAVQVVEGPDFLVTAPATPAPEGEDAAF